MNDENSYKRQFKYISVKLFKEEKHIVTDVLYFQYNVNADNINIYDIICFQRKRANFIPICKSFSKPRRQNKFAEIAKNRIKELIEKEPTISSNKIMLITGYDCHIITRYYMKLKMEIIEKSKC